MKPSQKIPCLSCLSNSGEQRISPGKTIYKGKYWLVEHAYPTGLLGWLVIVLSRHAEVLHELTNEEWNELNILQKQSIRILHLVLNCEKEYILELAESPGFKHIHFHIVAKPNELSTEFSGTNIF